MKRRKNNIKVDPEYMARQKESLLRRHRQVLLFNDQEMAAIDEYCRRYKVASRSSVLRQAIMERILEGLDDSHPTLF